MSSLFYGLCLTANILLPVILIYRSDGLWRKTETFQEQPDVDFKHHLIVVLKLKDDTNGVKFWSTINALNKRFPLSQITIPHITNKQIDLNNDGIYDQFNIQILSPIKGTDHVIGIKLIILFDYKLHNRVDLQMESIGFVQFESVNSGSKIQIISELRFHQKEPLSHRGWDYRFNDTLITKDLIIDDLIEKYMRRNLSTKLGSDTYYNWESKTNDAETFLINATILFPVETIIYKPGFWYVMKWAWIQYLSVYIILYVIIKRIMMFVFKNQLIDCIVHNQYNNRKKYD